MTRLAAPFTVKTENGLLESAEELLEKEKIKTFVFQHSHQAAIHLANLLVARIKEQPDTTPLVVALSADAALFGVYDELVRLFKDGKVSFKNVVFFSLAEYYPIDPASLQSYNRWIKENLLEHLDVPAQNIHLLEGTVPMDQIEKYIREYDAKITSYGGIDILIFSPNGRGYISFQEPNTNKSSKTRFISLDPSSRLDAASEFFGEQAVPKKAVAMGVSHMLSAKQVLILEFSEGRAKIVRRMVEDSISNDLVVSNFQQHPNVLLIVDIAAASELARFKCPWTIRANLLKIKYDQKLIVKAVIWLAMTVKKAILKLEDDDYINYNLLDLLTDHGPAYKLNVEVFNHMNKTITGWPGGKPKEETLVTGAHSPKMSREPMVVQTKGGKIFPKKVLIFSPHPDDDVISMGGTLARLVEQGHEVHVAYQTSGNIAVRDDDATRFANFATEYCKLFKLKSAEEVETIEQKVESFMSTKKPAQVDSREIQMIKGLIRRTEARNAARFCGVKPERIHFLELPFYETGRVRKKPLGEEDIQIVAKLLEQIQPHQIYAAGDLSDPHGTHRVCLKAIFAACERLKKQPWYNDCTVWLYRGAWQEWDLWDIEMAVPMSPAELYKKRLSIFRHQSQKDTAPFPGSDKREFWERSEARNKQTAKFYDELGLVEYEGMEAFVTWDVDHPDSVPY